VACGAKVKVQALGMNDDCCARQVMMNHSYFTLDLMLDYILTHDQATFQIHLLSLAAAVMPM
jgi:hypothetical protein